MKHLKTFENLSSKFKVGDYVYLSQEYLDSKKQDYNFYPVAKITSGIGDHLFVDLIELNDNRNAKIYVQDKFVRAATQEEIDEFEAVRHAIKYNL